MELSKQFGGELVVDSRRIQAPYPIDGHRILDGKAIILVDSRSHDRHEDCDFDLPDPGRNIVALDSAGEFVWTVSDPPRETESTEINYYQDIFTISGNLYARDTEKRIYEIDPGTGKVERSFDSGILPIKDSNIPVDGWLVKVIEFDDKIFARTGEAEQYSLYGFDRQGTELWRSEKRRGMIYRDEDILMEKVSHGPRTKNFYRLDPDTGERLAEIEVENTESGWKYVRDISDGG